MLTADNLNHMRVIAESDSESVSKDDLFGCIYDLLAHIAEQEKRIAELTSDKCVTCARFESSRFEHPCNECRHSKGVMPLSHWKRREAAK